MKIIKHIYSYISLKNNNLS